MLEVEFGTGSFRSCSATINGQMMIFGLQPTGKQSWDLEHSFQSQISIVESCRLKRLGTLPFSFYDGGCNTFKTNGEMEETLLCFGMGGKKMCYR